MYVPWEARTSEYIHRIKIVGNPKIALPGKLVLYYGKELTDTQPVPCLDQTLET